MSMGEAVVASLGTICLFGWPIVWVCAYYSYQCYKSWQENSLKRAMVERGYSAQEIVQVVAAKKGSLPQKISDFPPAKPVKHPAFGAN
ncbi:MAG: hypothetical protein MUF06_04765 [Pirellulaceae bacterium]|nr:hypothetical protein [Pirellulaceae bacterium]